MQRKGPDEDRKTWRLTYGEAEAEADPLAEETLAGEALAEALVGAALAEAVLDEEALALERPAGPSLMMSTTGVSGPASVPAEGSVSITVP